MKRGEPHADIEELLRSQTTLNKLAALALFDDGERAGDVMKRLNKFGGWAGDAFKQCNAGAHDSHAGDLEELVANTSRLAKELAARMSESPAELRRKPSAWSRRGPPPGTGRARLRS